MRKQELYNKSVLWWNSHQQAGFHTQRSWLNSWIIIFFLLTMHMFSDPHTFVILTPFLLPYLVILYRTQPITLLHFHSYFMHFGKRVWWEVFSIYIYWLFQHTWFNLHVFISNLYYIDKRVYKAKSSVHCKLKGV